MRLVQRPLLWLPAALVVVGCVAAAAPLGPVGLLTGVASAAGLVLLTERAYGRHRRAFALADHITMARASLACGSAALVADAVLPPAVLPAGVLPLAARPPSATAVALLVGLATTGLALDWVDGRVARATGTATPLGARFDMEVDAFLILVLSAGATRTLGAWVLTIGVARYALLAAERVLPFLRRPVPPRHWSKVVAATQGVVLTVVVADLLPRPVVTVAVIVALGLLAESFGHQVHWLWRTRHRAEARTLVASGGPV